MINRATTNEPLCVRVVRAEIPLDSYLDPFVIVALACYKL